MVALWTLPALWCRQGAADWFDGKQSTQEVLARTVAGQVKSSLTTSDFHTGNDLFNGEWLFGTYLISGIGLCQIAQQHPGTLERWRPKIEMCIEQLLTPAVREFDRRSWQEDPIESLSGINGHAAYLGHLNFLLGLYRQLDPANRFASLNDAITASLLHRFSSSPNGLIPTYPGEWYPVDNTPGLASIALNARATGQDVTSFLAKQEALFRDHYVDSATGLLIQSANADGSARDIARGSGSTLGVFFLCRACPDLSRAIYAGIQRHLAGGVFNFGAIREFARGVRGSRDIDSGPVVFGFGFSATGFGIGGARAYGDRKLLRSFRQHHPCRGTDIRRASTRLSHRRSTRERDPARHAHHTCHLKMKLLSFRPKALMIDCLAIVIAYAILFQIMLHTRMIEKVKALNFSWWELLLIALFLVARLTTYLVVPAVVVAAAVHTVMKKLVQR